MDRRLFLVSTASLVGCTRISQFGNSGSGSSASDAGGSAASNLEIATSELPVAQIGSSYAAIVEASNGVPQYTWEISPVTPTLSAWLQIDSTSGALTGTPAATGTDTVVILVQDSRGATATKTFTLTVSSVSAISNYVGVNIFGTRAGSYYTSNQKFLNVLKQAGTNNNNFVVWDTLPANGKSGDLESDAGGYITSLTGRSGAKYSGVEAAVFSYGGNATMPPGQTYWRPPGSYTFIMTGTGSVSITGDVSGLSTSSSGASVSGNTLTSTTTGSVSATFTASGTLAAGWTVTVTNIPDSGNYPRDMSLIETQYLANLAAGQIYHPNFKNTITATGTGGYSRIRFMDDLNTNAQTVAIMFNTRLAAGTTSATMKTYNFSTFSWEDAPWLLPSGTYEISFNNGQACTCTLTWNSPAISIGTPLTSPVSSNGTGYTPQAWMIVNKSWANRPLATDFSYGTLRGAPPEVCLQLCNEVECDAWMNHPIGSDSTWWTGLAQLAFNGAGATLVGFAGLNPSKVCYMELGNEVWNSGFVSNFQYAVSEANARFPGATCNEQQWYGMQTANMADAATTVYGSSFSSRVVVVMGSQAVAGQGAYLLQYSMNTPNWSSRAYSHGIGAICVAPYWEMQPSAAEQARILASANPLDTLFALAYSNKADGVSYSFTKEGYIADPVTMTLNLKAAYGDEAWGSLPLLGYESGSSMVGNGNFSADFQALAYEFHRDERQQYLYYDPQHQLSSNPGYIPALYAAGFQSLNLWNDCNPMSRYGEWGALEATMQTISPLSAAPPKYRGWVTFAQS